MSDFLKKILLTKILPYGEISVGLKKFFHPLPRVAFYPFGSFSYEILMILPLLGGIVLKIVE
jgi:hypothetical protein